MLWWSFPPWIGDLAEEVILLIELRMAVRTTEVDRSLVGVLHFDERLFGRIDEPGTVCVGALVYAHCAVLSKNTRLAFPDRDLLIISCPSAALLPTVNYHSLCITNRSKQHD